MSGSILRSSHLAPRPPIVAAFVLVLALALTAVASGAPSLTIDDGPAGPTSDATPRFDFTVGAEATDVACSIDQGTPEYAPCTDTGSHTSPVALADGDYTFRVRATDASLEVPEETVATRAFSVDTTDPALAIVSGPDGPTDDDAPEFGFDVESGVAIECSVDQDGATWGPCSGATTHAPPTLVDGEYTFRVRATDAADNVTTRTRAFTVDTLAPETTIDSVPLGTTADSSPSFEFSSSEDDVTFECRFDGPTFTACTSPKSYGTLAAGPHVFAVRANDEAGNTGPENVETFTVDFTNPELAIVSGPDGPTNDDEPVFAFEAENGTELECSIDQGTPVWGQCDDDDSHAAAGPLADGAYAFRVRATETGGLETTRARPFTVDTVAPSTAIDAGPAGPTNSSGPSFAFSSDEAGGSFECARDAEDLAPCASPKAYANLPDGAHSFRVRAVDAAGNPAPVVQRAFSVDTVAPTVAIGFGPSGATSDDSPLFEFTATGHSAVECSIDQAGPAYRPCSSAGSHVVTQRLAAGTYTFRVRASDTAGNAAVAMRAFTVVTGAGAPSPNPPTETPAPLRMMNPFPLVRLSGQLTAMGAKVKTLSVRAPKGSVVRIRVTPRCAKGVRCPVKSSSSTIGQKGLARFRRVELRYRAGTTIEIRVSQTGRIGKYTRFTIRRGKAPRRLDRCLMPGTTRASACPTA